MCLSQWWLNVLSNTYERFEAQLSNTESELKKSVAKKCIFHLLFLYQITCLYFFFLTLSVLKGAMALTAESIDKTAICYIKIVSFHNLETKFFTRPVYRHQRSNSSVREKLIPCVYCISLLWFF